MYTQHGTTPMLVTSKHTHLACCLPILHHGHDDITCSTKVQKGTRCSLRDRYKQTGKKHDYSTSREEGTSCVGNVIQNSPSPSSPRSRVGLVRHTHRTPTMTEIRVAALTNQHRCIRHGIQSHLDPSWVTPCISMRLKTQQKCSRKSAGMYELHVMIHAVLPQRPNQQTGENSTGPHFRLPTGHGMSPVQFPTLPGMFSTVHQQQHSTLHRKLCA
jgi:hypothetical protein